MPPGLSAPGKSLSTGVPHSSSRPAASPITRSTTMAGGGWAATQARAGGITGAGGGGGGQEGRGGGGEGALRAGRGQEVDEIGVGRERAAGLGLDPGAQQVGVGPALGEDDPVRGRQVDLAAVRAHGGQIY